MDIRRRRNRIIVDISVTLTTVLESLEARIIDISNHGAQIMGVSLPVGTNFHIEYMGQTIYAQCLWSEIDRIGVRFPFDLTEGPLHDMMLMAGSSADAPPQHIGQAEPQDYFDGSRRRLTASGFGRRITH